MSTTPIIILKNLFANKYFWYAVAAIIVLFILYKFRNEIKQLIQSSDIDYLPGEPKMVPDARQIELKSLASKIYTVIYSTETVGVSEREDRFIELNEVSDNELKFISKYYKSSLTKGNWLYTDIDKEVMPFSSIDETLMARLSKIGQKG